MATNIRRLRWARSVAALAGLVALSILVSILLQWLALP